jgi:hypothetical protein
MALLHVTGAGDFLNVAGTRAGTSCSIPYRTATARGGVGIPFCESPIATQASDGSRFLSLQVEEQTTRSVAYRATLTRTNGDTAFSRRYAVPPVAIPRRVAEDRLRAVASQPNPFPGAKEAMEKALEGVTVPPVYPPYSRALVGRDDTIWIELYGRSERRTWEVLDGTGSLIGRVIVPWNFEIQVAGRTAIWGVETDDDGIEHVVRYRVSR